MLMTYPAQQMEAKAKEIMVLTFIREFRTDNKGTNPTVREIGESFGWQPSTVHKVIQRLHRAGKVNREFGKWRGVSA